MGDLLPLFPLPSVVLFPNVFLPLHIFEPRYRAMISDALAGDRVIGMVLLQPGWEAAYDHQPPIYPIGCSGVITHFEQLPDGRYNIVLRGLERFHVESEELSRSYRRAQVTPLPERPLSSEEQVLLVQHRARIETLLGPTVASGRDEPLFGAAAMNDADLVNALSQYLDFEPLEKQALLERPSLRTRAESLIELLEMQALLAKMPGATRTAH